MNINDKQLPPDPEGQNDDRAEWARGALVAFQGITGTDYEDAMSDLLADLMHLADREEITFDSQLERARGHYEAETEAYDEPEDEKDGA